MEVLDRLPLGLPISPRERSSPSAEFASRGVWRLPHSWHEGSHHRSNGIHRIAPLPAYGEGGPRCPLRTFVDSNPGWRRSKACLAAFVTLALHRSMRMIVIPFPTLAGLDVSEYPFRSYVDTVCNAARAAGAECFDVTPALRRVEGPLWVSSVETREPRPAPHAQNFGRPDPSWVRAAVGGKGEGQSQRSFPVFLLARCDALHLTNPGLTVFLTSLACGSTSV